MELPRSIGREKEVYYFKVVMLNINLSLSTGLTIPLSLPNHPFSSAAKRLSKMSG